MSEAELGLGRLDEYEAEQRSRDEEDAVVRELEEGETVEEGPVVERKRVGKEEVQKIRVKLLLRRGKARMEIGGWAGFNGALEGSFFAFAFFSSPLSLLLRVSASWVCY